MSNAFRKADPFGIQRVVLPQGVLPQQAQRLDPRLPIASDELLIELESVKLDSSFFGQVSQACGGEIPRIEAYLLELARNRGKLQDSGAGSAVATGTLIGRVSQIGPDFPVAEKPVKLGDRVATLVSLSVTPLELRSIRKTHPKAFQIDTEGHAILFASGGFIKIPGDIPETVALALLDVAAVPARVRTLVQENQVVAVIGGGGKSGLIALYEAKQKLGVWTLAIEKSREAIDRLSRLSFVDEVIEADAREPVPVMERVWNATKGKMADVVIDAANEAGTEMACILSCRRQGTVCFFNLQTSFDRAALGAESVCADVDLRIGNAYTEGHAELVLDIYRDSQELARVFMEAYS